MRREERALKQWTRLIHGLRVRQRLQAQYAHAPAQPAGAEDGAPPQADESAADKVRIFPHSAPPMSMLTQPTQDHEERVEAAGGFLAGADRVVHAFRLPRNTHPVLPPPRGVPAPAPIDAHRAEELEETDSDADAPALALETYDLDAMDVDATVLAPMHPLTQALLDAVPKTMAEMAAEAAATTPATDGGDDAGVEEIAITLATPQRASGTSTPARRTRRKRARRTGGRGDSDADAQTSEDEDGEEYDEPSPAPSANKRTRGRVAATAPDVGNSTRSQAKRKTPTTTPTPTRTLRPRAAKTAGQRAAEAQREAAYRAAVAR